ncbi:MULTISPECIES: MarR family winged helix-turn-helix transcriptional regulator [Bosea]|jgi:DNA-binding MarR family transcriptional regulator|uniref:MarR family winged helix-turn-helix transcriptional regulator n=1 Tax=Bosea rubneri TaxID=3075434 RepID=A0ABU3S9N4_9HYPH|nr:MULTISPECIES: MarR family winged helix-turn-helix transcriptional regulator [unclassified Bosea (in: a-proteobacteria)]MDU0341070.1 MarR family winged helix-turn-helix transcriptional regulator [Bosea sp. ZW T0_25]HEV7337630.1 MarR family winged helix-turn-helix transcriptional regulator [Bosea sp. (in: a-proteobacteria)]
MSTKPTTADGERALHLEQFVPYRINVAAVFASRALARIYGEQFGIGIPEWRVIAQLGEFGKMTSRDIGELSQMHKTKVSRAVSGLDQRGLVARSENRADRRESFVSLTAAGARIYAQIVPLALAFEQRWTEGIAPDELRTFERVLAVLTERGRLLAGTYREDGA